MIRTISILALVTFLAACGAPSSEDASSVAIETDETTMGATPVGSETSAAEAMGVDEGVVISVDRLIPEEEACLVMMNVANATEETVTAGLFAFNVTGNGEAAGANMFPQTTEPGDVVTAQIILPAADARAAIAGDINTGCRKLIRDHPDRVIALAVDSSAYVRDIDTSADYGQAVNASVSSAPCCG